METPTVLLSNAMNIIFLVGIMLASLIRLADGLREHLFERFSLVLIVIGAFFMILQAAHPSGTSFEVLFLHAGIFLWICSMVYAHSLTDFQKWISR